MNNSPHTEPIPNVLYLQRPPVLTFELLLDVASLLLETLHLGRQLALQVGLLLLQLLPEPLSERTHSGRQTG